MERRNWSLEVYNKLKYIDSLEQYDKAYALQVWASTYLEDDFLNKIDLEIKDLEFFSELFYKNINFLKKHKDEVFKELNKNKDIQKFLK